MMLLGVIAYAVIGYGHGVGMYETYREDGKLCAIWWGIFWPVRVLFALGHLFGTV